MRSYRANLNLVAVSANQRETAINTEQTLDTSLLVDVGDVANLEPRKENNGTELIGKEEPDTVYDMGATSSAALNFNKAQPQHFALLLAYGLGQCVSAAAGTGYQHTITPIARDLDKDRSNPTLTLAQRYGQTVFKRRFASLAVDQVTATFAQDQWVKVSGQLKGTGKSDKSVVEEVVSAAANATTLDLTQAAQGADAATRLDSIHQVKAELASGVWTDVEVTAVSGATPDVLTIVAPGAVATAVNYKVLYAPAESGWMTFPPRVAESPLRVSEVQVNLGGTWSGTAFAGGRVVSSECKTLEYKLANSMETNFRIGAGGGYACSAFRGGRVQTLTMNREMRDYILQNLLDQSDTFGVRILAEGAEFDTGHKYTVEMIFPRVGVLKAPISVDGKRLAEAGEFTVLEDDTYGSAIVRVKNLVAQYAA